MGVWGARHSRGHAAARPRLGRVAETVKGTIFLLALLACASMMPAEKLPPASWQTSPGLGCHLQDVVGNEPRNLARVS